MLPASLAPVGFVVLSPMVFPRFGLSVSTKNVHFSEICPPNRILIRRRNTFFDCPEPSVVSMTSSCGCARKPNLMFDLPSLLSICHCAEAESADRASAAAPASAMTTT